MTYAIGQPLRLTKSLSVQAKNIRLATWGLWDGDRRWRQSHRRPVSMLSRTGRGRDLRHGLRGRLHGDRLHVVHLLRAR